MDAKKYYSLESKNDVADLYIFGDITSWPWLESDVSASGIVNELQSLDAKEINVHINSYGGEVAEGLAIYNTLKNSDMKVTTICDGFACSAASVIFMAGDERIINEASLLMIHNAWTYANGNATELRKAAEDLDKITQASVNAYVSRAVISEDEIKNLMDNPIDDEGRWKYINDNAVVKMPSFNGEQLFRIKNKEKRDSGVSAELTPIF